MRVDGSAVPATRRRAGATVWLRLFLAAAARLRAGRLAVLLPDGELRRFEGAEPGPSALVAIRDPDGLRPLFSRGDVGFAEAYMEGAWDSPDLASLLELGAANEAHLEEALGERAWYRLLQTLRHRLLRTNSRRGSRRNIAFHYDLGNDFYRLWLDETMTYSSALFESPGGSLADAQRAKYRRLIGRLGLQARDHVLEIGCGWGGFAVEAARRTGCRVTGITLSREQLRWGREQVRRLGLEDRVELRYEDYRDIRGRFDHVVSIEMFEAVGEPYWPVYFATVRERLAPGGRAALQVITIDDAAFDAYRRRSDFIQRYIFPGGMLPSPTAFDQHVSAAGLRPVERAFFGADYARTLACWHESVIERAAEIAALGQGERFLRMWRYYLAYCEAGFRTGRVDLMQTVLERPA